MGHRDVPGTFWPGHNQHDQNLSSNGGMLQHMHIGYTGSSDPNQVAYPMDNRFTSQGHIHPNWGHSTVSGGYSHTHHNNLFQHQQLNEAPLYHPFPPLPADSAFPRSHVYPSSSSSNDPPGVYRNEICYDDLRVGGRGSSKRKRFAVPFGGARETTNVFARAGSSSSSYVHPDFLQEKSKLDYARHWEPHAMWTSNSGDPCRQAIDEGATRNVRRRYGNHVGSVVPGISVPFEYPAPAIHQSGYFNSLDVTHWPSGCADSSWSYTHVPPAAPGKMPVADYRYFYQGSNPAFCGSSVTKFSSQSRGYKNHFHGSRDPYNHQNSYENLTRPFQASYSFSQQCPETNWNAHNASGAGPSHGCPQMISENYSSLKHSRRFQCEVFIPTGGSGGPRLLQERRRFLPVDSRGAGGSISEGFIDGVRSAMERFTNMLDQHSDMRLDVDNMTYEELVALGERIGNVCTGLSDDRVSECLIEVVHHGSSDFEKDGENCAICLEEYEKMDSVGKLRGCGHSYHSTCIKKWLSLKNVCPICKAPGLVAEKTENEGDK